MWDVTISCWDQSWASMMASAGVCTGILIGLLAALVTGILGFDFMCDVMTVHVMSYRVIVRSHFDELKKFVS